jgi:hypothetical protein
MWILGRNGERANINCPLPKQSLGLGTVLGREGLNTIIASTEQGDLGGQKPVCGCGAHTYEELTRSKFQTLLETPMETCPLGRISTATPPRILTTT